MKAKVTSFRRGRHVQRTNQLLLKIAGVDSKSAASAFIGKKVFWKTKSGKVINGKISASHGNNGVVRARFVKGVSGEVLGKDIDILE